VQKAGRTRHATLAQRFFEDEQQGKLIARQSFAHTHTAQAVSSENNPWDRVKTAHTINLSPVRNPAFFDSLSANMALKNC